MEYFKVRDTSYGKPIEKVEITRETDSSIFMIDCNGKERRAEKVSHYKRYYPTFEEGKNWLIGKAMGKLRLANDQVEFARKEIARYKALEKEL